MGYYDEQLIALGRQIERLHQLDAQIGNLLEQTRSLESRITELQRQSERERDDVTRLESGSLARLFALLTGSLDEKLTKERAQALEAEVRLDAARSERDDAVRALESLRAEADTLRGCEARYQAMLKQKAEALRRAATPDGERILALEKRENELALAEKEIEEAIAAGFSALNTAEQVIDRIADAEGLGVWDVLGGGLISDLAKHDALNEAQALIEQLQIELGRFRCELAGVRIDADFQAEIGGFLHFADYFFDGLFADWAVMSEIGQAKQRAEETRGQIASVINRLEEMRETVKRDRDEAKRVIEQLIRDARL